MTSLLRVTLATTAQTGLFVLLFVKLRSRKKAGQWKRPWSYPVAMTLLSVALALAVTSLVLALGESSGLW